MQDIGGDYMVDGNMDDFVNKDADNSDVKDKKEEMKLEEEPKKEEIERFEDSKEGGMNFWKIATIVLAIALVASVFTGFSIGDITGSTTADVSGGDLPEINMIVINDESCFICDTSQIITATRTDLFPSAEIEEVSFDSKEGKELIEEYGIEMLPAYLLSKGVEEADTFAQIQGALIEKGDMYLISPEATGAAKMLNLPEMSEGPSKGDKDAPITIYEFSEFKCPYCAAAVGFNEDVISYLKQGSPDWEAPVPAIMKEYVEAGKVRIVFKNFIVHDTAREPGMASLCADDQGKFWEMHDLMFDNQDDLSRVKLEAFAESLEIDMDDFNDCLDSSKYSDAMSESTLEGRSVGISGTPGFLVGDMVLSGAQGFDRFKQVIDSLLE